MDHLNTVHKGFYAVESCHLSCVQTPEQNARELWCNKNSQIVCLHDLLSTPATFLWRFIWWLLKSILPQLRDGRNYCKQSVLQSITCGYASVQIWAAQWPVYLYLVLWWPVLAQKGFGNPSNADKFFPETFLTFRLHRLSLIVHH